MKDHFGMPVYLDDKVLVAQLGGYGTTYKIGTVVKLYPIKKGLSYSVNKVRVKFLKQKSVKRDVEEHCVVCYTENVVVIRDHDGIKI